LALEGELSPAETQEVTEHCAHCWECRTLQDHLATGIRKFIDHREKWVERCDPPPRAWQDFTLLLHRTETEERQPSWSRKFQIVLRRAVGSVARLPRLYPGWSSATAIAVIGVLLYNLLIPATVDAETLLSTAVQATAREESGIPVGKTIHERVEIRVGTTLMIRDVFRGGHSSTSRVRPGSAISGFETVLETAALNPDNPLDARVFQHWRESLPRKREYVDKTDSSLKLTTIADSQSVWKMASLVVRSSDRHPISESLTLGDGRTIWLRELSHEIVLEAPVPVASTSPAKPESFESARMREPLIVPSSTVSSAALAQAELNSRLALHSVGADLGEEIVITRGAKAVTITAFTDTEQRKGEVSRAVSGLPLVVAQVRTYEEAIAAPATQTPSQPLSFTLETVAPVPLLAKTLSQRFPDEKVRADLVNHALAQSQSALDHGFALERLASRYSAQEQSLLDAHGRQLLGMLITGHYDSVVQALFALDRCINEIDPGTPASAPAVSGSDWRHAAATLRLSLVETHKAFRAALGGANRTDSLPGQAAVVQGIRERLASARAQLESFRNSVLQEFSR
jgi:hypothetical protein